MKPVTQVMSGKDGRSSYIVSSRARSQREKISPNPRARRYATGAGTSCPHNPKHHNKPE